MSGLDLDRVFLKSRIFGLDWVECDWIEGDWSSKYHCISMIGLNWFFKKKLKWSSKVSLPFSSPKSQNYNLML